ncbi:MAG TPA: hypothetical protein VFQ81_05850 [Candidatus Limnocylindria bacterium]|nr:hypothetical protein [Candidatus Limnocylindria bacterium]
MARITVVDDYAEFLGTMTAILDGLEGHAVAAFTGADTTLDDLVRSQPDLLIVDLHVFDDHQAGLSVDALASAAAPLGTVPMIICSGDLQRLRDGDTLPRDHGIYTLEKPFDVEDLTALVDRALHEAARIQASA